ncbi:MULTISPECIES: hypothetical protein [Sorangium]|uniref:hypothetical protein n=1 Tax=Sorangium TaxID=39643 RepID=UPI00101A2CB2|nr:MULTISPECIES: hypothetical protein [Sorangium]
MALLDSVRDASAEGNVPLHLLLGLVSFARRLDRLLGAPGTPAPQPGSVAGTPAPQPGSVAGAPAPQPGSVAGTPAPQPGSVAGAPAPPPAPQPGSVVGTPAPQPGSVEPGSVEPPPRAMEPRTGAAASPEGAATDARSHALIYLLLGAISVRRTLFAELVPLREARREQVRREGARREDRGAPDPAAAVRGLRSLLR